MKRFLVIAAALAIIVTAAAGCKAKSANDYAYGATAAKSSSSTAESYASSTQAPGGGSEVSDPAKKVIKDASLYISVESADKAFANISTWADSNGASEFKRAAETVGKNRRITVVYKIKPERLNEFLAYIGSVGEVTRSDVTSSDITDQYYDAQARLGNLKNGREQLLEVQKKAVTIDEILRVQRELTSITGEIEALEGRISMWDKLIAESTVTLTIIEKSDPMKPAGSVSWKFSSIKDIWQTMKNGFTITINVVGNIIIWLLIVIASLSPLLAGAAAVVFIVRAVKKAKRRKQQGQ